MAEKTISKVAASKAYENPPEINWLREWKLPVEFPDLNAKEAYKGLIRIYLSTWLALYNTFESEGQKYELKEFGEEPGGSKGFFPVAKLNPPVKVGPHTDASGDPRSHLIPPPPPR